MNPARSPVWHPFTQHALLNDLPVITRAEGAWLHAGNGRALLDAISSWWVITHGHRYAPIIDAICAQSQALDQVLFAGLSHQPAEDLARQLIAIAPEGLSHVFYSDSGSTAVEVALKMALGYWRHLGASRHRIIALQHAYHGDTVGAMSAGARGVFSAPYAPLLFEVARIPFPSEGQAEATLQALERECRRGDAAALIVEPLILGAGGMLVYSPQVLAAMRQVCARHEVLFIADEVMTGWGRTGTLLASTQADVVPDILCLAKGLTGGALPLAVTLCRPEIFDAHYSTDRARTFFHSSSYTANPIACAAALANLKVWRDEPVLQRISTLAGRQREWAQRWRGDERFARVRHIGTIVALDVAVPDGGYLAGVGPRLYDAFLKRDLLLRPLGNTIYVMPPYCITADELSAVYDGIDRVVSQALRGA